MLLVVGALAGGCSTNPHFMTPKITAVLGDSILHTIRKVSAYTYWSQSYGHGLKVEVWVPRSEDDYERNLELELEGVTSIFASLAKSDLSIEWDFVEVHFFNDYGEMPPRSRSVIGVVDVIIKRETLVMFREKHISVSEYPQHWVFVHGYKDQPDSTKLLKW